MTKSQVNQTISEIYSTLDKLIRLHNQKYDFGGYITYDSMVLYFLSMLFNEKYGEDYDNYSANYYIGIGKKSSRKKVSIHFKPDNDVSNYRCLYLKHRLIFKDGTTNDTYFIDTLTELKDIFTRKLQRENERILS